MTTMNMCSHRRREHSCLTGRVRGHGCEKESTTCRRSFPSSSGECAQYGGDQGGSGVTPVHGHQGRMREGRSRLETNNQTGGVTDTIEFKCN
jgi:hypothetical protein